MGIRQQLRIYQFAMSVVVPANALLAAVAIAVGLLPGVLAVIEIWRLLGAQPLVLRALGACAVAPFAFLAYGWTLALAAALMGRIYRLPGPGARFGVFSWRAVRWGAYGFWTGVGHLTFVSRVMPFAPIYWRLMGARVGKRTFVPNPIGIADFAQITIGDECTIGSDVIIIAHTAKRTEVILEPVTIGSRVTLGTQAIISSGVTIEDDATIGPSSFVLPRTHVGRGETWVGVPARKVEGVRP